MRFNELRAVRKALSGALSVHRDSILAFKHSEKAWFVRDETEIKAPKEGEIHHLSTTASCLESLDDVPNHDEVDGVEERAHVIKTTVATEFAQAALDRADDDGTWSSEGAARVYCRVRTLPALLRFAPHEVLSGHKEGIDQLIDFVWTRVKPADFMHQGVAEDPRITGLNGDDGASHVSGKDTDRDENSGEPEAPGDNAEQTKAPREDADRQAYPPNAFHSYWAIRMLDEYEARDLGPLPEDVQLKRQVVHLWAEKDLAAQTGLILNGAQRIDAHQLAWALATDVRRNPEQPATAVSPRRELYEAALKAFFQAQRENGNWPRYEPLFHYPKAGNAYCYTFETLAELIRPALERERGRLLRDLLRDYAEDLVRAWEFAESTAIELDKSVVSPELDRGILGWCSGHHPHRTQPEAWATAAVFSFLQALRRLVGCWTAEAAKETLDVGRSRWAEQKEALQKLRERGDTWVQGNQLSTGRRLAALFLHPVQARAQDQRLLDPDRRLIASNQGRSAILFGPPGTSKTTLVEALAGAIDWEYVEIHASDFLRDGMDKVPAIADEIFAQLMELDRCVVLFDEIDELIRERDKQDSDPFGRFLTTSMLPKIAKLWEQRRILFFVATNHIDAADPAIRRSQRFDAAIFAAPPSFGVKMNELRKHLQTEPPSILNADDISASLAEPNTMGPGNWLGVFALLRFDQMAELADRARAAAGSGDLTDPALLEALEQMGTDLARTEWNRSDESGGQTGLDSGGEDSSELAAASPRAPFELYREFVELDRRDYRSERLLRVDGEGVSLPAGWAWLNGQGPYLKLSRSVREALEPSDDGEHLRTDDWEAVDDGLLCFEVKAAGGASP